MEILKTRGFENIYHVEPFFDEFNDLFSKSGQLSRYRNTLFKRVQKLDVQGVLAIDGFNYEKIEGPVYAIRDKSTLNPRTLFALIDGKRVYLLSVFLEKFPWENRVVMPLEKDVKGAKVYMKLFIDGLPVVKEAVKCYKI